MQFLEIVLTELNQQRVSLGPFQIELLPKNTSLRYFLNYTDFFINLGSKVMSNLRDILRHLSFTELVVELITHIQTNPCNFHSMQRNLRKYSIIFYDRPQCCDLYRMSIMVCDINCYGMLWYVGGITSNNLRKKEPMSLFVSSW